MHATIRRYDGVDQNRTAELTSKVNETLVPKLEELPGARLGRRPRVRRALARTHQFTHQSPRTR